MSCCFLWAEYSHPHTQTQQALAFFQSIMYFTRRRLVIGSKLIASRYYSIFHPGFMIDGRKKFRPLVECEQSLFFSMQIYGGECRRTRASSGKAARREKRGRLCSRLSRLAPSVSRVVIFFSRTFRSTD